MPYIPDFSIIFTNHHHKSYSTIYLHAYRSITEAMRNAIYVSSVLIVIDDSALRLFTFLGFALPARLAWEDSFLCVPYREFEGF